MASNQHELYRGKAVIMGVNFEGVDDWFDWEKKNLPEADKLNAFKIVYDCALGDANGERHDVKVEISHRELSGKALEWNRREDGATPTQIDIALKTLKGQGLLPKDAKSEADLDPACDDALCGREVFVRIYEEPRGDGTYYPARAAFCAKYQRITGADKAARLAAFKAGRPAPAATAAATVAPSAQAVSIPAPDDAEDMPF